MENFNKLVPIDGENGEKRTISSLQIAEITGKAYCGVLKVIRKMDIMRVKITMKNIFSLFVCLKKCCTFVVLQLTIKYANGIFYARKETYILKIRKMDIMRVKITMKNIFSLFVCLKKCCTFVVLQLTIKYANGIFYARKETYILKYRQTISVYHRPMAMVGCSKLGYLSAFLFNNK